MWLEPRNFNYPGPVPATSLICCVVPSSTSSLLSQKNSIGRSASIQLAFSKHILVAFIKVTDGSLGI